MAGPLDSAVGERSSRHSARGGLDAILRRIPLPARVIVYGVFFLAAILGGLCWLASQVFGVGGERYFLLAMAILFAVLSLQLRRE